MQIIGKIHAVLDERIGRTDGRDWSIREVRVLTTEDLFTVALDESIPTPKPGQEVDYVVRVVPRQTRSGLTLSVRAVRDNRSAVRPVAAAG
jgi:hypothetical protein